MRITPDARHHTASSGISGQTSTKSTKSRKRTLSGQDQTADEPADAAKSEDGAPPIKNWTLDTADLVTVGEVYTVCGGVDGRLPLTYFWDRRNKTEVDSPPEANSSYDAMSLLRALVNVAKSSLTKGQPGGGSAGNGSGAGSGSTAGGGGNGPDNQLPGSKKTRRQIIPLQISDASGAVFSYPANEQATTALQSPLSESSPTQAAVSMESPIQVGRFFVLFLRPFKLIIFIKKPFPKFLELGL